MNRLLKNKKGFTLAELLIVVAIIGVLVAISIPIFTSQLEKAREATDLANIRAAYAEVMASALTEDASSSNVTKGGTDAAPTYTATVSLKQEQNGWQSTVKEVGGVDISTKNPTAKGTCTVTYSEAEGVKFTFS